MDKDKIYKWMADNEDKHGNVRTADLFVFLNFLAESDIEYKVKAMAEHNKKEIAKRMWDEFIAAEYYAVEKGCYMDLNDFPDWLEGSK